MINKNNLILIVIIQFTTLFAELIHPINGSTLNYIHMKFIWNTESNLDEYTFELSNNSNFNSIIYNKTTPDTSLILKK